MCHHRRHRILCVCVNNETTIDVVDEEENDNNVCLLFVVLYSSLLLLPYVVLCLIKKKAEATKQHADGIPVSRDDDFKTKKIRFFFFEQRRGENISVMSVRRSKLFFSCKRFRP